MTMGYNQTTVDSYSAAMGSGSTANFETNLKVGKVSTNASNMRYAPIQVVNREGRSLTDAKAIVARMEGMSL